MNVESPDPGKLRKRPKGIFGVALAVPAERPGAGQAPEVPRAAPDTTVTDFEDNGGTLLRQVKVVLMFWGSAWNGSPTPTKAQVVSAISSVFSTAYMFKLLQYRGIGNGRLLAVDVDGQSDPPNPFSPEDVLQFVADRMKAGAIPRSDTTPDAFYCVIMPSGVSTTELGPNGVPVDGAHYSWAGITRFCFVRNDGTLTSVNSIPKVLTHEMVEACSDPEVGSGIVVTANGERQEIGDVCDSQVVLLNGVGVQPYWSQSDQGCTAPRQRFVSWYLAVLGISVRPVSLRFLADQRGAHSLVGLLSLPI